MAVAVEHVAHRKKKQYDPMSPPQLPTFGTVPILPHTFQIVLRLSRPRTWTFAASSFIWSLVVVVLGEGRWIVWRTKKKNIPTRCHRHNCQHSEPSRSSPTLSKSF